MGNRALVIDFLQNATNWQIIDKFVQGGKQKQNFKIIQTNVDGQGSFFLNIQNETHGRYLAFLGNLLNILDVIR